MMTNTLDSLLDPVIASMGYEYVGSEQHPQGNRLLVRIYLDSPTGITVDDCVKVSRQLSLLLDAEEPIKGDYVLEVSSPGLDRPLFTLEHYKKVVNRLIKVKMRNPVNGRRNFQGLLKNIENDTVTVDVEGVSYDLPYAQIAKANLVVDLTKRDDGDE